MQTTFIRHLPTEWNKKKWLQGRKDIDISPLTEEFQEGVASNQYLLKKWSPFDLVLASTLVRTAQTAHLYGYFPEQDRLLDELDFGHFEGKPKEQLLKQYGEQWFNHPKTLMLGENITNLENRIILFLKKYKAFSNILVFGHGAWIRAILSYHQYGHINNMNKITLENNQYVKLSWHIEQQIDDRNGLPL